MKCQNEKVLFSYLQLLLSHPLMNERSGSEEGCPYHFLLHIRPLKTILLFDFFFLLLIVLVVFLSVSLFLTTFIIHLIMFLFLYFSYISMFSTHAPSKNPSFSLSTFFSFFLSSLSSSPAPSFSQPSSSSYLCSSSSSYPISPCYSTHTPS